MVRKLNSLDQLSPSSEFDSHWALHNFGFILQTVFLENYHKITRLGKLSKAIKYWVFFTKEKGIYHRINERRYDM